MGHETFLTPRRDLSFPLFKSKQQCSEWRSSDEVEVGVWSSGLKWGWGETPRSRTSREGSIWAWGLAINQPQSKGELGWLNQS